ncbi:hypothetical protein [Rhizobium leguminosarum]|uniref:hypothetical protein n=1 Tax=Rhizobium leguminosarum TaxID=384 RepID=UPI0013EF3293|nr:hypothetical protein [Rhizobium leguminosarum]
MIGKSLPRVASNVIVSRSYFQSHFRDDIPVSMVPCRQVAENFHPAFHASPIVSISAIDRQYTAQREENNTRTSEEL